MNLDFLKDLAEKSALNRPATPKPEATAPVAVSVPTEIAEPPPKKREPVKRDPRDLYTTKQAASLLGVQVNAVQKMIQNGTIPASRLGRAWVITREAVFAAKARPDKRKYHWRKQRNAQP